MKLYNTLTRKIEEFKPLNPPKVGMYTCGPTVYNFMHIGNLRSFTMSDVLVRVLEANGLEVKSVRNITDIEDKIIKNAKEKGVSIKELTNKYTKYFFEDLEKLNITPVSVSPKATEYIEDMISFTEDLVSKGVAYVEEDGSVYFDISKFPGYGKLSNVEKRELKTGTRTLSDEYSKDDVTDFALWKSVGEDEFGYNSPWGKGRPGWHIECSVMSQKNLGDTFDIHTGGIDLLFPHHENEIAQSEGRNERTFARYFVHFEHLLVNNQKMSKSLNNFYTLKDLEDKGYEPLAYRYLVLTAHYRDKLNFTWDSLSAAQNALNNLRDAVRGFDKPGEVNQESWQKFLEMVNNNLNTPQALAVMWEMVKSDIKTAEKSATLLVMDKVLGLKLDKYISKPVEVSEEVKKLLNEREEARKNKDWTKSDDLRDKINSLGYEVLDTPTGQKLKEV